jgi:hypothetical protein
MLNDMTILIFVYTNAAINTALLMTTISDIFTSAIIPSRTAPELWTA